MIFKLFNYVRDLLLQHASHYFVSPQQNASRSVRFFYYEDTYKKQTNFMSTNLFKNHSPSRIESYESNMIL